MKKIISILLVALILLSFVACGKDTGDSTTKPEESTPASVTARDDSFVYSDVVLSIGEGISADTLKPLGEPLDKQSAPSCHFDGNDTIYIYDGLKIYTYADGDKEIVYLIEITSDVYSAKDGAKVGMTLDEIKTLLGAPSQETAVGLVYSISDTTAIRFTVADSVVTMIEYEEAI